LPNADGTWMVIQGGMGTVSRTLAECAQKSGAVIETNAKVTEVIVEGGVAKGVRLEDGREIFAKAIVSNADPFKMTSLAGDGHFPAAWHEKLRAWKKDGSTFKVNMALRGLPKFTCLPEDRGQHQATIHLLPEEKDVIRSLTTSFEAVKAGKLAEFPTIEWYIHTTVDPSMRDPAGNHNSALFVQWVPYSIAGSSWEAEEAKYVKHLLSICDRFAPGTSDLVVDTFPLHPQKIESHFGISRGHIHHVDNAFGFSDRVPYVTPVAGLYAGGAGCHPAGSVIGAAGRNAAKRVLADMGR
jgi:phytoene dehydrogenase-like protein